MKSLFAILLLSATAALAAEPLAVRVTVYQRLPEQTAAGEVAEPELPGTLLTPPASGWTSFEATRAALAARHKGRMNVLVAAIHEPKPLTAAQGAAFFVGELGHAVEVKADGDVLLPNGHHTTIALTPGTTSIFGASDEQFYVAVSILKAADAKDDTVVVGSGQTPLDVVSRVEPKFPVIETMHHFTGIVLTQLRIEPDGSVSAVNVLQRVQPQIEAAAVAALKQWRFEPAKRDGKPVAAYMMMSTAYRIE